MNTIAKSCKGIWLSAVALALCVTLTASQPARAEDLTAKALLDRAQIQDLITHYYYNFGKDSPENFADFYADDAELILGDTHFKGRDGIAKAYSRAANPATPIAPTTST